MDRQTAVSSKAKSWHHDVLPDRSDYCSPGHHVEGGSLAEILFGRSATRWLRLYG
jgi:hypothetical protein